MHIEDQPAPTPNNRPAIWDLVIADMKARDKLGRERYGTPLQAFNGRDALVDAFQEALDLSVYLRQAIAEREANAHLEVHQWRDARDEVWRDGVPPKNHGRLYETRTLYAAPHPAAELQGYLEAAALARAIFDRLYAGTEPYKSGGVVWELCDTTAGVISQIDNMIAPLVHQRQADHIPDAGKMVQAAQPRPWAKLLHDEWQKIDDAHDWRTPLGRLRAACAIEALLRSKNEVKP